MLFLFTLPFSAFQQSHSRLARVAAPLFAAVQGSHLWQKFDLFDRIITPPAMETNIIAISSLTDILFLNRNSPYFLRSLADGNPGSRQRKAFLCPESRQRSCGAQKALSIRFFKDHSSMKLGFWSSSSSSTRFNVYFFDADSSLQKKPVNGSNQGVFSKIVKKIDRKYKFE